MENIQYMEKDMSTSNLCVRVDSELKNAVESCLADMGLNLSTAITIYLKRIARDHEIPFKITAAPRVNQETIDAIAEGHRLAKDPNAPVYHDIKSLFEALDS